jgi:hypothetical protein
MLHDWHNASQRSSMPRCGTGQPLALALLAPLLGSVATNETELLGCGSITRSHMGQTPGVVEEVDNVQVEVDALEDDVDDEETVGRPKNDNRRGGGEGSLVSLLSLLSLTTVVADDDSIMGGCNCGWDSDNSKPAESAVNHVSRSLCVLVQQ